MLMTKVLSWTVLLAWTANAWSQQVSGCGSLTNGYGPYDYTSSTDFNEKLPIVEQAHFTPEVEALIAGNTGSLWGDLDYTLRAFPNHHRALYAMARYALQPDRPREPQYYSAECYFSRAMVFKPDDGMVRMIYGIFLHKQDKLSKAAEEYRKAVRLMPDSPEAHYNLGLLYADIGEYAKAREAAEQAYALDYPLEGLKNKLRDVGEWE